MIKISKGIIISEAFLVAYFIWTFYIGGIIYLSGINSISLIYSFIHFFLISPIFHLNGGNAILLLASKTNIHLLYLFLVIYYAIFGAIAQEIYLKYKKNKLMNLKEYSLKLDIGLIIIISLILTSIIIWIY